jgi:hypothetical protein
MTYGLAVIFDQYKELYILSMVSYAIGIAILARQFPPLWFLPFLLEHLFVGNNPLIFIVQIGLALTH